jgi:Co/Zn/Cd efflux system component
MRASWIFSRSDVLANLGVLLAGLLVWVTTSRWPDLIIGAAIAAVVIKGGLEILREANAEEPMAPRPT